MKIRTQFLILAFLLLTAGCLISALILKDRGLLFYLTEGVILVTLLFLIYFYQKVVKPIRSIGNGMELLREQDFSSRLSPVGQKDADRIVQVFNRMMEQLKDERLRLREQNHFLDLLISASPMGVIILDFDDHISMLNQAAVRFMGYTAPEELTGEKIEELNSPLAEELNRIARNKTETIRLSDSMIYRCSRLSFVDRGFAHPFILIESLTSEVVKAEKKAYEKVIRMIAHEVNNTVAGITSTLESVSDALQDTEDSDDLREVMQVCVERCYSMSRFITNFADVVKIPDAQLQTVYLNERVTACKRFMENICRNKDIQLHISLCEENPQVQMDTTLFEQVIVNILKNAAESIEVHGNIYIQTTSSPVTLEIADTGAGISREVEARLFSPFFSTKPNGQGIGLIFIRDVLIKHGCTFSLRTWPDGLTRFLIRFPHNDRTIQPD